VLSSIQPAHAGDEVDYSAPYVVVENGELVTKYPAKEHKVDEGVPGGPKTAPPGSDARLKPILAAAIAGLVLLGFVIRARRSRNGQSKSGPG
jgi:hypothetical protein